MGETMDQIFVTLKHWLVGFAPGPVAATFLGAAFCRRDRRHLSRSCLRSRRSSNARASGASRTATAPTGSALTALLQPIADGLKALTKEDIVPRTADKVVHFLAPLVLVVPVFLALAVVPMGRNMTALDMDAGVLFFFAVGAATELSVFMAGWSSRNKYSLLGAMRAIAQMISYEVPLILSAVTVIMAAGSLSTVKIVEAQAGYWGSFPHWYVLTPWGLAGFILFMIAGAAESNRSPFDLPEGESEIIAGYYTEYSGFKFALFFLGEYLGLFAVSGLGITLFLGGWHAPLAVPGLDPLLGSGSSRKLLALIAVFIWVRGTLPRLRMDQLMGFAWKFMLPMALVNIVRRRAVALYARGRWCAGSSAPFFVAAACMLGCSATQCWSGEQQLRVKTSRYRLSRD